MSVPTYLLGIGYLVNTHTQNTQKIEYFGHEYWVDTPILPNTRYPIKMLVRMYGTPHIFYSRYVTVTIDIII